MEEWQLEQRFPEVADRAVGQSATLAALRGEWVAAEKAGVVGVGWVKNVLHVRWVGHVAKGRDAVEW